MRSTLFKNKTGAPRHVIAWKLVKEGEQWKLDEQLSTEKLAA